MLEQNLETVFLAIKDIIALNVKSGKLPVLWYNYAADCILCKSAN